MSMPEAAVNEYGNSMLWKNEIRFSEYVLISPPTGDSEMSHSEVVTIKRHGQVSIQ